MNFYALCLGTTSGSLGSFSSYSGVWSSHIKFTIFNRRLHTSVGILIVLIAVAQAALEGITTFRGLLEVCLGRYGVVLDSILANNDRTVAELLKSILARSVRSD